jgi:iron complex transport system ATP-binding protein
MLRPGIATVDVVITAKHAALEAWWHTYDDADRGRALELLEQLAIGRLADREFGTLSSGEQQRVQLARTLMSSPDLLLLDEPTARLDLGGRERFVASLAALVADPATPPTVLVTHHVDEIPPGFTHALLLRGGEVVAAGPIDETLTSDALSACFDLPLRLEHRDGRWAAWATTG